MPPDFDEKWLLFARNDLKTAEILFREAIWNQVCFHSQQALEKLLKALIPPDHRPRSHKLADLIACLPASITLTEEEKRLVRRLDRFYIPTRYPDALPGAIEDGMPTMSDAEEALQTATSLFKHLELD